MTSEAQPFFEGVTVKIDVTAGGMPSIRFIDKACPGHDARRIFHPPAVMSWDAWEAWAMEIVRKNRIQYAKKQARQEIEDV